MSAHTVRFAPGYPAFYSQVRDEAVELSRLAEALWMGQQPLVWLDSARVHQTTGQFSIVGWDPWLMLRAQAGRVELTTPCACLQSRDHPLAALRRVLQGYRAGRRSDDAPPIGPGLLGALSYELNGWIERLPPPKATSLQVPEVVMWGMRQMVVVDHGLNRTWLLSVVDPDQPKARAVRDAQARLADAWHLLDFVGGVDCRAAESPTRRTALTIEPMLSQQQFEALVRRAKADIAAGEIFQANLAQEFHASWPSSPWVAYHALRQVNPSPFACLVRGAGWAIAGCSPERLVRVRGAQVDTRPIAGTRPRGSTPQEDVLNSMELFLSDKERAEHIMLVDLERNDLGRVCRTGSVEVEELMALEEYSHVIHIVSNVRGQLQQGVDLVDVIRAMFPGGTITGCPKVRCMQIIHELEPCGRSFYTGSCGYLGFDGSMDLNILIRTLLFQDGQVSFHVGAGIVADSIPEREYRETLAKAAALVKALHAASAGVAHALADR
jgi:aminodeoxychorismate synthase component I